MLKKKKKKCTLITLLEYSLSTTLTVGLLLLPDLKKKSVSLLVFLIDVTK